MTSTSANDVGRTYTCREPNCTAECKSDRGLYSRCDFHRAQREKETGISQSPPRKVADRNGGGLVARLDGLKDLAKRADRAEARARDLTKKALAAKQDADELRAEMAREMREIGDAA